LANSPGHALHRALRLEPGEDELLDPAPRAATPYCSAIDTSIAKQFITLRSAAPSLCMSDEDLASSPSLYSPVLRKDLVSADLRLLRDAVPLGRQPAPHRWRQLGRAAAASPRGHLRHALRRSLPRSGISFCSALRISFASFGSGSFGAWSPALSGCTASSRRDRGMAQERHDPSEFFHLLTVASGGGLMVC